MIRRTVLAAVVLAGCAAQPPSPQAPTRVRLISAERAQAECERLGKVELYRQRVVGGMPAAQLRLRAKVAQAGGNAYVVTSQYIGARGLTNILADVYRCRDARTD